MARPKKQKPKPTLARVRKKLLSMQASLKAKKADLIGECRVHADIVEQARKLGLTQAQLDIVNQLIQEAGE